MASMNYFNSSRKSLTYFFKWKSVMEMHFITKFTNLHVYSCFSFMDCNLFVNMQIKIYIEFYHCIICIANEGHHVRIYVRNFPH